MSTVAKLNPEVRARRAARKECLRALARASEEVRRRGDLQGFLRSRITYAELDGVRKSSCLTGREKSRLFREALALLQEAA